MTSTRSIRWALIALLLAGLACAGTEATPAPPPAAEVSGPAAPTAVPEEPTAVPSPIPPTEAPTPVPGLVEAGTHIVGEDIQPGIYQGRAGEGILDSCYWERLNSLAGDFESIIANDNGVGLFYLEVKETDLALKADCPLVALEQAPPPDTSEPATIGPGTYLVGRDIRSGRYRGQGGADVLESCYWERLANVSSEFDGILANDNGTGQFFVQVAETDFALHTACELEYQGP
jgi:hypothetical protein